MDLQERIRATGILEDFRSMRSSTIVVKWPHEVTRAFNSAAFEAANQYGAVLAHPNEDNLRQGTRAHEEARRAVDRMR